MVCSHGARAASPLARACQSRPRRCRSASGAQGYSQTQARGTMQPSWLLAGLRWSLHPLLRPADTSRSTEWCVTSSLCSMSCCVEGLLQAPGLAASCSSPGWLLAGTACSLHPLLRPAATLRWNSMVGLNLCDLPCRDRVSTQITQLGDHFWHFYRPPLASATSALSSDLVCMVTC